MRSGHSQMGVLLLTLVIGVAGVVVWRWNALRDEAGRPPDQVEMTLTAMVSSTAGAVWMPESPPAGSTPLSFPTVAPYSDDPPERLPPQSIAMRASPVPTQTTSPASLPTATQPAVSSPESSIIPTATATSDILPTPTSTPAPRLNHINGIHQNRFVHLPEATQINIRTIYTRGQMLGRNPRAFAKLGDSTIDHPYFMGYFDDGRYDLGHYAYLQPVIDYFAGSFERQSVAVRVGLHTWSVMDPMWSGGVCASGEHMLSCEIRLHNPAFIFIRLGSNDAGVPGSVERSLRRIVEYCIENGVIPILGTKADRFEGYANTNNNIIRQIAADYNVPLWDFDVLAESIPGRGLASDRVHMTNFFPLDYNQPTAFQRGHSVHSLSALIMLESLMEIVRG